MSLKTFDGLIPSAQRAAFCQQFTGGALSLFAYAPEREFVFETGYEIEGELGYSITFYQKRGELV